MTFTREHDKETSQLNKKMPYVKIDHRHYQEHLIYKPSITFVHIKFPIIFTSKSSLKAGRFPIRRQENLFF